jgi:hypothetical protein
MIREMFSVPPEIRRDSTGLFYMTHLRIQMYPGRRCSHYRLQILSVLETANSVEDNKFYTEPDKDPYKIRKDPQHFK